MHTPRTWEVKAERSGVKRKLWLNDEFEVSQNKQTLPSNKRKKTPLSYQTPSLTAPV